MVHKALPFYLLGLFSLLGAGLSMLLTETAGEKLPETVEEAEQFGLNQKFPHIPFLVEKRKGERAAAMED